MHGQQANSGSTAGTSPWDGSPLMGWISPDAFSHANQVEKDRKAKCQRWEARPALARQAAPNQQPRVRSGAYASWKGRAGRRRRGKRLFPSSTFCLHGFPQTLNYLFPFPTAFRVSYSPVCTRQETSSPVPGEGNARSSPRARRLRGPAPRSVMIRAKPSPGLTLLRSMFCWRPQRRLPEHLTQPPDPLHGRPRKQGTAR